MEKRTKNTSTAATSEGGYASLNMGRGESEAATWAQVDPLVLHNFVIYITMAGDAPLLGTTRQGGLAVTIYNKGNPIKFYSNSAGDMCEKLRDATRIARLMTPVEVIAKYERE